jgi:sugar phosphate isomerase/epimerase
MSRLKHSITLYGFATKYANFEYTFEDCLRKAKELGGDGIEFVAPQMLPSYPKNDDSWNAKFKELIVKYELNPICYSAYIDLGMRSDRDMDDLEKFESTIRDLYIASKLGFSVLRSQFSLTPRVMEKCLPYAEDLGIHLAVEMHGPHTPGTPIWQEYLELFVRKNSSFLGIVPDMSSFLEVPPATFLNNEPEGKQKDIKRQLLAGFNEGRSEEDLKALNCMLGGDIELEELIKELFYRYFRNDVNYDGLAAFLKYSKYIHGKFYYVDENLDCSGIDYPRIMKLIKEANFDGYIASEYEGDQFDFKLDDMEQIRRHIRMLDKLWL